MSNATMYIFIFIEKIFKCSKNCVGKISNEHQKQKSKQLKKILYKKFRIFPYLRKI